ncbi:hypothetical protein [Rhodococcus jostii]|nr:hypothetical protein [Rhodococcus jostii]
MLDDDIGGFASGPPEDPAAISAAIDDLRGGAPQFLIRMYAR